MLDHESFGKAMAAIVREAQAPLLERIKALEEAIAFRPLQGPPGEAGPAGERGEPGRDADPIDMREVVAQVLAGDELKTLVSLEVAAAVAAMPIQHGKDGERGPQGERGEKGDTGADGIGQAGAMIDREGCLTITTTKGENIKLGCVVGKDGKDGAPGRDGADFTECSIDYDGERTITIRGKGGELTKRIALPIDRGYWADGAAAEKGDVYTFNGSVWIALCDTKEKPSHENKQAWRLMVRKGRDGVDGRNGRDLGPAPPVKLGGSDGA